MRLVPLDEERHLGNAQRWINDPEVTAWIKGGDFPMTMLAEREWFQKMQAAGREDIHFAIETLEGEHIGFSGIMHVDWRNGIATTGTLIGATERWGCGYGTDASRIRARYSFETLGLRMLLSAFLEGNHGSKIMNERAGYVEYGRLPKALWKRGEYRDMVRTVLTRERWADLHKET